MAHTALIVAHAASVAAKARTRILDSFRLRDATSAERALPLAEFGFPASDRELAAFIKAGVIRGVDDRGRPTVIGYENARVAGYYLDEAAYIAERDRKARSGSRAAVLAIVIALVIALIPLLFLAAS